MGHGVEDRDHGHDCGVGCAEEEESEGDACDVAEDGAHGWAQGVGGGVFGDDAHGGVGVFADLALVGF